MAAQLIMNFKRQSRLQQMTNFAASLLIFEKKGMVFHENRGRQFS